MRLALVLIAMLIAPLAAAAPNETCASATVLDFPAEVTGSTVGVAEQGASPCAMEDTHALWYRFKAPADTGVDDSFAFVVEGHDLDVTLALYYGCDVEPLLGCRDDLDLSLDTRIDTYLEPEQEVWIRVAGWGRQEGDFSLRVDHVARVDAPANDECEHPIAIALNAPGAAATYNATGTDLSSCGSEDKNDIWYVFTAPADDEYRFAVSQHSIHQHFLALFDACGGAELACGFENAKINLVANQTVHIRVGTHPSSADWFNVVVRYGPTPEAPANDSYQNAIAVTADSVTQASTLGASIDEIADWGIDCPGHVNAAIWYSFVAPEDGNYFFDTTDSGLGDTVVALFGPCDQNGAAPPDLYSCNDFDGGGDHGRIDGFMEAGEEICIAVAGHFLGEAGPVTLEVGRQKPRPANDTCPAAVAVEVGDPVFGVNYDALPVDITTECPGGNFGLWYRFTAPADGIYKFDTKAGNDSWPDIALYADCQNAAPLACSVEAHPAVGLAMTEGQTVRVRVSTTLYWRGTLPLRVTPVVEAEVEPGPEAVEVVEAVAEEGADEGAEAEAVAETEAEAEAEAVAEAEADAGAEAEVGAEAEARARADGGCGCSGGGADGWVIAMTMVLRRRRK